MYFCILLCFTLMLVNGQEICSPTKELTDKEEKCLDSATTFLERAQHRASGVLAYAKRKTGINPEAEEEPLNCSYYLCVLKNIGMANKHGILELDAVKAWMDKNVPKEFKDEMTSHASACFEKVDKSISNDGAVCDQWPNFIKCLHEFEKCQIFKFP